MEFYNEQIFHIYNQGNNRQQIFFSDENYHYFLWKMRAYLLPFGDLIAWCLMPNHFHWLVYVKNAKIQRKIFRSHVDEVENNRRIHKYGTKANPVSADWKRTANKNSYITLGESIGILEKTYTRAINKQNNWTGSLFRKKCHAKDGFVDEFITLKKLDGKLDYRFMPGNNYAYQIIHYIHENSKRAGIAIKNTDYTWSSARDYAGLRKGTLCNLEMGREILNFV